MKNKGFTLVELIIVIVILGILAVSVAPKFMNMSSDAKAATLVGLKGALSSGIKIAHVKMMINNQSENGGPDRGSDCDRQEGAVNCVNINGTWIRMKNNYPDRAEVFKVLEGYEDITVYGQYNEMKNVKNYERNNCYNLNNKHRTCTKDYCYCVGAYATKELQNEIEAKYPGADVELDKKQFAGTIGVFWPGSSYFEYGTDGKRISTTGCFLIYIQAEGGTDKPQNNLTEPILYLVNNDC